MHAIVLSSVYPVESISTTIPGHQFHDKPVPSHALSDRRGDSDRGRPRGTPGMGSPRSTCTVRVQEVRDVCDLDLQVQRCKGPVLPIALYIEHGGAPCVDRESYRPCLV